jgi:hypothetical protein
MRILIIGIFFTLSLLGCRSDNKSDKNENNLESDNDLSSSQLIKINDRLFSIPAPVQVSFLVKEGNIPFNKSLLSSTSKVNTYTTNFKKALNIGIYGANLGYLNTYEQFPDGAIYFAAVKQLGDELGINSYFDKAMLKRIENNSNNKDSLIYIMSNLYQEIDGFLINNERNIVGILVLAGGWVESLYFMTQTLKQEKSELLINRIGEQKNPLDNLIALLRPYYGTQSDELNFFIQELINLAVLYDGVEIKYLHQEPKVNVEQRLTIINTVSKTMISDYQLNAITDSIAQIRQAIVD